MTIQSQGRTPNVHRNRQEEYNELWNTVGKRSERKDIDEMGRNAL